jgi:hypothetical protein
VDLDTDPSQSRPRSANDFLLVMRTMFDRIGVPERMAATIDKVFDKCGLEHVHVTEVDLPFGAKLPKEEDKADSITPFAISIPSVLKGCESRCLPMR